MGEIQERLLKGSNSVYNREFPKDLCSLSSQKSLKEILFGFCLIKSDSQDSKLHTDLGSGLR